MSAGCRIRHIILILFCCLAANDSIFAQESLSCDHRAYLSLRLSDGSSAVPLYSGDPATGDLLPFEVFLADAGTFLTCLGYSTQNYLYGLDPNTYELYRIGAEGQMENLGIPAGLDTSYFYRAGTMSPDGIRMVLMAQNKTTSLDEKIVAIRTDLPNLATSSTALVSEDPIRLGDIAFDPYYGNGYGFDELNKRLVNIGWPGGLVTSYNYDQLADVSKMGSLFFDTTGVLYAYGSSASGSVEKVLYTLNKGTGEIVQTRNGPSGLESDGCNCPYRIRMKRSLDKQKVLPCESFIVEYALWNTAGTVYTNINLLDVFPPGFEIQEILQVPYSAPVFSQGVGDDILSYDEFDLLLGQDTLLVQVGAPAEPGIYNMQAEMGPFPPAFNLVVLSDDPRKEGAFDPNVLTVIGEGDIFSDDKSFLCPGGTTILETGLQTGDFLWNDGSTEAFLEITTPGIYWVEVMGECGSWRDTIEVELLPAPLQLDLGPDREARIGTYVDLTSLSNTQLPLDYVWLSPNASLDCIHCPAVQIGPLIDDAQVILEASNAFGCFDSDTLNIRVLKDRAVYMPNAFSPEGNGINDRFYPQGLENASINYFRIFNRWGQLIFESTDGQINDPDIGWDGVLGGKQLPEGIYVWTLSLTFEDGYRQKMAGDVLLMR
ncbi:MAG: gliding motility-associated C-terminal domain-containing protein [Bacteroidetes bacterium]|nr:gliding motility-associated C-terminal domain-containing protein [Bacteroidota bacterium]